MDVTQVFYYFPAPDTNSIAKAVEKLVLRGYSFSVVSANYGGNVLMVNTSRGYFCLVNLEAISIQGMLGDINSVGHLPIFKTDDK